jgi:hypothetical protein
MSRIVISTRPMRLPHRECLRRHGPILVLVTRLNENQVPDRLDVVIAYLDVMADRLEMMFQRSSAAHELGDGLGRHMSNLYGAVLTYSQRRLIENTQA